MSKRLLARLLSIRKCRATLAGVEFDHSDTPDAEHSTILRHLGVRLPLKRHRSLQFATAQILNNCR